MKNHAELAKMVESSIEFGLERDPKFFDESKDGNLNAQRLWGTYKKAYDLDERDSQAFLDILMIKLYDKGLWIRT